MRLYFGLAVFLLAFIVFALTAAPDLMFTDSGELASACVTYGVAHPTGYPLFSLLGFYWTKLPLPFSVIRSLNLYAAFSAAASSALFYWMMTILFSWIQSSKPKKMQSSELFRTKSKKSSNPKKENLQSPSLWEGFRTGLGTKSKNFEPIADRELFIIAGISALFYAFARTIWAQATAIEVHALQLVLVVANIGLFLRAILDEEQKLSNYLVWAFVFGLNFTNHLTVVTMLPAVIFLYFKRPNQPCNFSKRHILQGFFLLVPFAVALSLYALLPVRSNTSPDFDWGGVGRNFEKFWYHVSGKQFRVWLFTNPEAFSKNFTEFHSLFFYQLSFIGIVPFVWGIWQLFRRQWELCVYFLLLFFGCLFYVCGYDIHDIDSYFVISFISALAITGFGIFEAARRFPKYLPAFVALPILALALNYAENDESKNQLVPEYTNNLLNNLQPNALILSSQWDFFCSAFWYKTRIEKVRTDVALVEKELLRRTWYVPQTQRWYPEVAESVQPEIDVYLKDLELFESEKPYDPAQIQKHFVELINGFIDKNYGKRPIYITLDILQTEPDVAKNYTKIPEGFAFRLEKSTQAQTISPQNIHLEKIVASKPKMRDHLAAQLVKVMVAYLIETAKYAQQNGQNDAMKTALEKVLEIDPRNAQARKVLGK